MIAIHIGSPSAMVDKAFRIICEAYKRDVSEHMASNGISLEQGLNYLGNAIQDRAVLERFIAGGEEIPRGNDLDYLLAYFSSGKLWSEVGTKVVIGSDVDYPVAACGDEIRLADGKRTEFSRGQVPEDLDKQFKQISSLSHWFFHEASDRYIRQQGITF